MRLAGYRGLDVESQALVKSIFLRLTELGEGTQDTRRRAELEELVPEGADQESVAAALKVLVDARLVTTAEQSA